MCLILHSQISNRLRKIVRRALNISENVFENDKLIETAIVPEIVNILGHVYPELEKNCENIKETFRFENDYYKLVRTRNRKEFHALNIAGSNLTEDDTIDFAGFSTGFRDVEKLLGRDSTMNRIPIDFMYDRLHVSLGLTEEIIEKIAAEKNLIVNMENFAQHKQRKQLEAKMSRQRVNSTLLNSISVTSGAATDYSFMYDYSFDPHTKQYNVKSIQATIQMIRSNGDLHHIVLDRTNFYHTAGGQDADVGQIIDANGNVFTVETVEIHKGHVIHTGHFEKQPSNVFHENQVVNLHVDSSNRTGLSQHHTAMHLLQAALKYVTGQIIFQQSSHVTSSAVKCDLGSIGKRIDMNQLSQVERLVQHMIHAKIPIEVEFLMAHDLYALDNVTTIPGEVYPDENIRVLKMKNECNNFESIEPCCGTHARNTGDLDDFCITAFKFNGNTRSYDVTAIAGQLVSIAKENEQNLLDKYEVFKNQLSGVSLADEWKMLETQAIELSKELMEIQMPYVTKAKLNAEIEEIKKNIHLAQRALLRKTILTEMIDVLNERNENDDAFIIHVLNSTEPLEESLLMDAERVCHDLPVIILNVSNNKIIHARASIPIKYTTNQFNAKHWMEKLGKALRIKCQSNKKKKQFSVCGFLEIPDKCFSSTELQEAIDLAKTVAQEAFDKLVAADKSDRNVLEENLRARIDDVRNNVKNETNLTKLINLENQSKEIRNHMKDSLFLYTTRAKCTADLISIDEQIFEARSNVEKYVIVLISVNLYFIDVCMIIITEIWCLRTSTVCPRKNCRTS